VLFFAFFAPLREIILLGRAALLVTETLKRILTVRMSENAVAKEIVDVAYRAHTILGPGLLESVYEAVMASELQKRGLGVARQQMIPVVYEGARIEMGFRADLVVQDSVIVEIKSIAEIAALHRKQLLTYFTSGEQAAWPADQFQRGVDQGWHHARRQWTGRIISRKDAKNAKKTQNNSKAVSLHREHLYHLVPEMIDNLHCDSPRSSAAAADPSLRSNRSLAARARKLHRAHFKPRSLFVAFRGGSNKPSWPFSGINGIFRAFESTHPMGP
jgi:GxxExxY protein